jgi:cephalosporin hydroxylase
MIELTKLKNNDLGINVYSLYETVSRIKNGIFVDLGVRQGISSKIMLLDSDMNNNKIFGIDVDFSVLDDEVRNHPNYTIILGDSSTVGKNWDKPIDILFIDTFHIKQQVLCELYYWYPHLNNDGFIIFHDTNWPLNKYDNYDGIVWPRPEEAIKDFFGINELNYEDEFIQSKNYPESFGLTIINIKQKKDFISLYKNWNRTFEDRNHLISLFWNEHNKNNIQIDLNLQP